MSESVRHRCEAGIFKPRLGHRRCPNKAKIEVPSGVIWGQPAHLCPNCWALINHRDGRYVRYQQFPLFEGDRHLWRRHPDGPWWAYENRPNPIASMDFPFTHFSRAAYVAAFTAVGREYLGFTVSDPSWQIVVAKNSHRKASIGVIAWTEEGEYDDKTTSANDLTPEEALAMVPVLIEASILCHYLDGLTEQPWEILGPIMSET